MKPFRSFVPPLAAMLMAASPGTWAQGVLIDKSEIRFVSKQMGASIEGRFRKWKANVDFRPLELDKSKANFEIELGSIDLASEESEAETRRPVWFDTAKFPVARFTSSAMRKLADDRFEIAGTLAMKGTSKGVLIPVALAKDAAGNAVATGQFTLKRLEFRIGEGMWADTAAVADEVVVRVRMVLPPLPQ
ncbi:MAG: YceI family protein [Betaproteobacteria bacterium]